jgi:structure-specific endonuclease subunit SLX1
MNNFIVYLLKNTHTKYTYLGITNNSPRRIRQHNGEIKGGAKYTRAFKGNGIWVYHLKISNLTKSESLSMERTAKNLRRKGKGKTPLEKRISILLPLTEKYPHCEINYF